MLFTVYVLKTIVPRKKRSLAFYFVKISEQNIAFDIGKAVILIEKM